MAERSFGKYTVMRQLGSGGMAEVYLARDPMLERSVAIKVIRPYFVNDAEFDERFRREARLIASLRHPNIVHVYEFDMHDGAPFLVMEYLEGGTLKDRMAEYRNREEMMPLDQVSRLLTAIAEALDYAHERGLVHRDLKPANILFTAKGEPVITDFGIAKILGDATQMTLSGQMLGTPAYMSPEQASNKPIDKRSDIYSLGVILYEMVTGTVPFKGESTTAVMMQHLMEPPPPPRTVNLAISEAVQNLVLQALAKELDKRFTSAGALASAFRTVLHAGSAEEPEESATLIDAKSATLIRPRSKASPRPATPSPTRGEAIPERQTGQAQPQGAAVLAEIAQQPAPSKPRTPARTVTLPAMGVRSLAIGALIVLLAATGVLALTRLGGGGPPTTLAGGVAPLAGGAAPSSPTSNPTPLAASMATPQPSPAADTGMQSTPGMNMAGTSAGGSSSAAFGVVRFADGSAHADQIIVTLTGVQQPGSGHRYEAWLIGKDGESRLSLGKLDVDTSGNGHLTFVDKDGQNLLAQYNRFEITVQPEPDPSTLPSDIVPYSSGIPPGSFMHIGHLLVAFDDTPNHIGFTVGLLQDAKLVKQVTDEMLADSQKNNFELVLLQAERLVNLIEGKQGQEYGDLDHNGVVSDQSDGFGLLLNGKQNGYIEGTIDHAKLAAQSPDATDEIKMHSVHVTIAAKNISDWATQLRDLCLKILAASSNTAAQPNIRAAAALGDRIVNGIDLNGDETVDPVPGEGGAIVGYQHAYYMADMPILSGPNEMPTPGAK